jgi:hypothetical protein
MEEGIHLDSLFIHIIVLSLLASDQAYSKAIKHQKHTFFKTSREENTMNFFLKAMESN